MVEILTLPGDSKRTKCSQVASSRADLTACHRAQWHSPQTQLCVQDSFPETLWQCRVRQHSMDSPCLACDFVKPRFSQQWSECRAMLTWAAIVGLKGIPLRKYLKELFLRLAAPCFIQCYKPGTVLRPYIDWQLSSEGQALHVHKRQHHSKGLRGWNIKRYKTRRPFHYRGRRQFCA